MSGDTALRSEHTARNGWDVTVRKQPGEKLGLVLEPATLALTDVQPNTPAAKAGVIHSVGRTLVKVDGEPVTHVDQLRALTHSKTVFVLTFEERKVSPLRTHDAASPSPTQRPQTNPNPTPHQSYGRGRPVDQPQDAYRYFDRPSGGVYEPQGVQQPIRRPTSPSGVHYEGVESPRYLYPVHANRASPGRGGAIRNHQVDGMIDSLEARKREAIHVEDYREAERLKAEIERLNATHYAEDRPADFMSTGNRVLELERRLAETEAALATRDREIAVLRDGHRHPSPLPHRASHPQYTPPEEVMPVVFQHQYTPAGGRGRVMAPPSPPQRALSMPYTDVRPLPHEHRSVSPSKRANGYSVMNPVLNHGTPAQVVYDRGEDMRFIPSSSPPGMLR